MRSFRLAKCFLLAASTLGWSVLFAAEKEGDLQQSRMDFIKNFKRIRMNTGFGDGGFLRIVIESTKAKRGVEVGTANGYGAIWMGMAFERNGGRSDQAPIKTTDIFVRQRDERSGQEGFRQGRQ